MIQINAAYTEAMSTIKQFDFEVIEQSATDVDETGASSKTDELVKVLDDKVTSLIESLNCMFVSTRNRYYS